MATKITSYYEFVSLFWAHVDDSGGHDACWPWINGTDNGGYGMYTVAKKFGFSPLAHVIAWVLTFGPIDKTKRRRCVCHSCDTPACCNPAHLWLGLNRQNNRDRNNKGRTSCGVRHRLAVRHGSNHYRAKLTKRKVLAIRKLYARGGITMLTIARIYALGRSHVEGIINRRVWKHV